MRKVEEEVGGARNRQSKRWVIVA